MKNIIQAAQVYQRLLQEKYACSRETASNCCTHEATRRRGRYRQKDGGGGGKETKRELRPRAIKKRY